MTDSTGTKTNKVVLKVRVARMCGVRTIKWLTTNQDTHIILCMIQWLVAGILNIINTEGIGLIILFTKRVKKLNA